jgi:hypothetical protein
MKLTTVCAAIFLEAAHVFSAPATPLWPLTPSYCPAEIKVHTNCQREQFTQKIKDKTFHSVHDNVRTSVLAILIMLYHICLML